MLSWGENRQRGFRLRTPATDGGKGEVHFLNVPFNLADLSAGHSVLAFVKTDGTASIIRTTEATGGGRTRGKQKRVDYQKRIRAVSCTDRGVTLLCESGKVLCLDQVPNYTPKPLDASWNVAVSQVACGSQHSVALTRDGQVYTWGQNSRGQLGLGTRQSGAASPQHLPTLSAVPLVHVAAGGEQSFALSLSGNVFGWGRNDCGQLGLGDTADRHKPSPVCSLNMKKIIHVSCGSEHTAVMTKGGVVFTFGSGRNGQLGHNSFRNELLPRLVAELWGAKVTKIACGRYHTLVLTDSSRIYSFGCGDQGQLGRGDDTHPSVPLPVYLLQSTSDDLRITTIYAGGDCSFAAYTNNEGAQKELTDVSNQSKKENCLDNMIDRWISERNPKSWKKIKAEIHQLFSSASCLNQSFLDRRNDEHFLTSAKYSALNVSLARSAFKKLLERDDVLAEVEAAITRLLPSLNNNPVGVEGLRIFLLLNELLYMIQKHRPCTKLAEAVAAAIVKLPAECLHVIGDWWASLTSYTMVKHVTVWKRVLSVNLSNHPVPRNSRTNNLLLLLQNMHHANSRIPGPRRIPESSFCLKLSGDFVEDEVRYWRLMTHNKAIKDKPLILGSFPFVMDLQTKKQVFDINTLYTMASIQSSGSIPRLNMDFFKLKLGRASLLKDAFKQLAAANLTVLKNNLLVLFDESPHITQVYKKDFFHHFFLNMIKEKSEMFMFNDSRTLVWFPSREATEEDRKNYFLFGLVCGLALYNKCIIDLRFPMALFKKLVNVEPSLEDMIEFRPDIGKSLQYIVDYEDDDLENLYMNFVIPWDDTEVDLDPQNPEKPVTSQNKEEFVDAYVNYVFSSSVESLFQEFRRGFFQVCDQDLVNLFRPEELKGVLVGKDVYEWTKLKQSTVYSGRYYDGHPTIQMFWEVFEELTEDQRKDFLHFVTGFKKVPIFGMEQVKMEVRDRDQAVFGCSNDQHFPESLTCYSILDLPLYSNKEIMRDRLTEALMSESGFN
ncbi:probable E3 ubiquitin-protein ligase HERC3 [Thalassophryne amazonica]|uniref:probable E3 ubiquitin-protein ligase HERC3 n=1 Tax=Thalassophryne amazonica TaxID=390379 RepID=UPI001471275D|nr:probable E3 ubiquitin-protein ligase HERC3 [Thalassophryne amazonica]